MCMQCVAEGATYVGGAVGALQVLKLRARSSRRRLTAADEPGPSSEPAPAPTDR